MKNSEICQDTVSSELSYSVFRSLAKYRENDHDEMPLCGLEQGDTLLRFLAPGDQSLEVILAFCIS